MKIWTDYLPVVALIMAVAVGGYYYLNIVNNLDYLTMISGECDPEQESCFQYCQDASCADAEPYKKILVKTARITECTTEECVLRICKSSESACLITYCSDETLKEGEICASTDSTQNEGEVHSDTEALMDNEATSTTQKRSEP